MIEKKVQTRKEIAVRFLKLVVAGRIDEAYKDHVDMEGRHHNPFFPAGFPALKKAMTEDHARSPNKEIVVSHALGDGDMVVVHSHLIFQADEPGMTVVHLFRFRGDKIVEMWDCGQALPPDSPNRDGAF